MEENEDENEDESGDENEDENVTIETGREFPVCF